MNFKFFSILAFLSIVAAQSDVTTTDATSTPDASGTTTIPTVPSGAPGPAAPIPDCVQTCIDQSGCSAQDVACLCTTGLQTIASCVMSGCSAEDQTAAAGLQSLCPSGSGMSSGSIITGSATTQDVNITSSSTDTATDGVPSITSNTRTTPAPTLTPRPLSTNMPTSASTSADAATSTNAAAPQNLVAKGVWVMFASLIGVAVAA